MARPKNFRIKTKRHKFHKTTHRKQHINEFERTKRITHRNVRYEAQRQTRQARTRYNNLRANNLTKFSYSTRYQHKNGNIAFRKIRNNTNFNKVRQSLQSARDYNNKRTSSVNGVLGSVKGSLNSLMKHDLDGKSFTTKQVQDIINKGGIHTSAFWDAVQKVKDQVKADGKSYKSDEIINAVIQAVDDSKEIEGSNEAWLQPNVGKGMDIKLFSGSLTSASKVTKQNAEQIADYAYAKLTGAIDKFNGEVLPRPI